MNQRMKLKAMMKLLSRWKGAVARNGDYLDDAMDDLVAEYHRKDDFVEFADAMDEMERVLDIYGAGRDKDATVTLKRPGGKDVG